MSPGDDFHRKPIALPAAMREEARTCGFRSVAVPVFNTSGAMTGMRMESPPCGPKCNLYDVERDLPCVTAATERIVEAIGKALAKVVP